MKHSVPDWYLDNPLGVSISSADVLRTLDPNQSWEIRFRDLLALGDQLSPLPQTERVDKNRLHGCQATVWVAHIYDPVSDRLYLNCDSDARVVKGLLACVISGYNAKSPADMLAFDGAAFLADLDLAGHIASERSNGLLALIGKARMLAHRYATTS